MVSPYGVINESAAIPSQTALNPFLFNDTVDVYPKAVDAKALSGTAVSGHIRNYTLSKYQNFGYGNESYLDIVGVINRSRNTLPNMHEMGIQPVDVLIVRNRSGKLYPNLEDLFQELQSRSIQYKKISLVFCRSNILQSKMKSLPVYIPPTIGNS